LDGDDDSLLVALLPEDALSLLLLFDSLPVAAPAEAEESLFDGAGVDAAALPLA
jgi:hypothetical protein